MIITYTISILLFFSSYCFAQQPVAEARQHLKPPRHESHAGVVITREINQKSASLLDSLSALDLPDELANMVDSLQAGRGKLTPIGGENLPMLLPTAFHRALEKLKTAGNGAIDPVVLARADQLLTQHSGDLKTFLQNTDIGMNHMLDNYTEQLNEYLSDAEWAGLANNGSDPLSVLTENAALIDDRSITDLPDNAGLENSELEQLLSEYGSLDAETLDGRIDALAQDQEVLRALQKETAALENLKSEQLTQMENLNNLQGQAQGFDQQMALKKGRVMANEQIMNNTEIVETAMKQADALKKKYAFVNSATADGKELEQPVKHVQTQKRFFYGGDMQLLPGDPFGVDFAVTAGYRTGNRTAIGLAASIRQEFNQSENYMPDLEHEPVYSGRAFFQYKAFRSFYLQGETEAVSVYGESAGKVWEFNYLAGIGRSIPIKNKLRLNIAALYHINNQNSLAHDKPFVIRIGLGSM